MPGVPCAELLTAVGFEYRPVSKNEKVAASFMTMIATIVLNWNRANSLERTLTSYAATVEGEASLIVVDNGSSDHSREVIEAAIRSIPDLEYLYLSANCGGEAINFALDRILDRVPPDGLIQISENDQIFMNGWAEHARRMFACFPQLGQLSLHGVTQSDDEIGNPLPGAMRFERGLFLYETAGNVGTASILPAALLKKGKIRVHNIASSETGSFNFPDDSRLSAAVRALGYFCAWSHKSYTHCLGHDPIQIEGDPDYYARIHSTKPSLGVEGLKQLMADARSRPPVVRRSVVFSDLDIQPERTSQPVGDKPSRLWSMFDGWTVEVEVLDFFYSLVRLLKPRHVVETGAWLGRSAVSIGSALRDNGFGALTSIEINPDAAKVARDRVAEFGLNSFVSIMVESSLAFEPHGSYDLALFDSDIPIRAAEFQRFYEFMEPEAVILFHDTAAHHVGSADNIHDLITMGLLEGLFLPTPRGLFVGKTIKPALPQQGVLRQVPHGFNPDAYRAAHPDVAAAGIDPGEHYRFHGWREGRRLSPAD